MTAARALGVTVIDRCNLTILSEPGQEDLARFLADEGVRVVASLPCYEQERVDLQRGQGVYERSIAGLKLLNQLGYAQPGSSLELDLVFNPLGCIATPASLIRGAVPRGLVADPWHPLLPSAHDHQHADSTLCAGSPTSGCPGELHDDPEGSASSRQPQPSDVPEFDQRQLDGLTFRL